MRGGACEGQLAKGSELLPGITGVQDRLLASSASVPQTFLRTMSCGHQAASTLLLPLSGEKRMKGREFLRWRRWKVRVMRWV